MFDWLGESPAAGLQWVDIVLSFIAFGIAIVALPTIFQMFWGRPTLEVEFTRATKDQQRMLGVFVRNPPVKFKPLKRLGIRRDSIQSLTASFQISEAGSGTVVASIREALFYTDEELEPVPRERISLPPTFSVATSFPVAMWMNDGKDVVVAPDRLRDVLSLQPGLYRAKITIMVDGEPSRYERKFVVGAKADDLVWAS